MGQIDFATDERLGFEEFKEFLNRTDLEEQFPEGEFEARVSTLLRFTSITVTARDKGKLIGVALALSDFAYFAFLTDLALDRAYVGQGLGRRLLELAHETAGGVKKVSLVAISADDAMGFYEKCGMKADESLRVKWSKDADPDED